MTAPSIQGRSLHWVLKIGDRTNTIAFLREIGMQTLRHEEFQEGCDAACNGKYDGRWSKTMIGFGNEDNHFVVELTYNYGIKKYSLGNDFLYLSVKSKEAFEKAKTLEHREEFGARFISSPDGYQFKILNESVETGKDPVSSVALHVSDLQKSLAYWRDMIGMKLQNGISKNEAGDQSASLYFAENQAHLELVQLASNAGKPINHSEAYGRIAFSCPRAQLPAIQEFMKENGQTILTPLISLDTPGKATVEVVILADPDGYEICFVGDEAFKELSQFDPEANSLLQKAIDEDDSVEYLEKREKHQSGN